MDIKHEVALLLEKAAGLSIDVTESILEVPPRRDLGDFALPCFSFSKTQRKPPNAIANEIKNRLDQALESSLFSKVLSGCEAEGGYLNIRVNRTAFIDGVLNEIIALRDSFGKSDIGGKRKIIVEFSSPNIAKPFHIGHLCTTAIGASLERIFKFLGYDTVAINHIGDWGTQFGKLISAFRRWGDKDALRNDTMNELLRVYVRFHKELSENPELDDEARRYFLQLEEGVPDVVKQWREFRDYSIKEFERIYKRLGISFDAYDGESFYSDKMDEVLKVLESKGLLTESDGAKIVDLSSFGLNPCMVVKSDGATIYATRDLAAALYRKRTYDFFKNIYVVGTPQALHFKQVFSVLKLMGYEWSKDCVHVGYGHVRFPDRKMATREGEVIELEGMLDESVKRAAQMIGQNRKVDEPEKVAEAVGIGALIYTLLRNGREHDIIFKWDDMLDLEGDSGPYLQYTHARVSSVLRNAEEKGLWSDFRNYSEDADKGDCSLLSSDEEFELAEQLNAFPAAVADAALKYEPSIIARHILNAARAYNKFYHYHNILNAEPGLCRARLSLCFATRIVIGNGLSLLGIVPLWQM